MTKTTFFGILAIVAGVLNLLLGAWSFHIHWISSQSIYFNVFYAEIPSLGLMAAGLGLVVAGIIGIHAADHKDQ